VVPHKGAGPAAAKTASEAREFDQLGGKVELLATPQDSPPQWELESTAEIPQLEKTVGADGKQRNARATEPEVQQHTAPAEISVEQRRAENAWLADEATEATIDKVVRDVNSVVNIILRHVEGLSSSETELFFAVLRDRINDLSEETEAAE
jgi:hypothetical protein